MSIVLKLRIVLAGISMIWGFVWFHHKEPVNTLVWSEHALQSELISILLSAEEELLSKISPGNCSLFCWVSSPKPLISSLTVSYIYPVSPIDPTPASPSLSPWTSLHAPLSPSCSYFLLWSTESKKCFLLEPRWLPLSEHCAGNSSCSNSISGRATSYLQTVITTVVLTFQLWYSFCSYSVTSPGPQGGGWCSCPIGLSIQQSLILTMLTSYEGLHCDVPLRGSLWSSGRALIYA